MSKPITVDDLPPHIRAMNAAALGEHAGILPITQADVAKELEPSERTLQGKCEAVLVEKGYKRLSPINCAEDSKGVSGWFGHLFEARKNPLMPDLFIFDAKMRRCLMVELKVKDIYQCGQQEMILRGCWVECRSAKEFRNIMEAWEMEAGITGIYPHL
jgi:hypothetical protein